ncbi:bifunctional hydroxymethylpyrimidine kinase/phosphomethylpyrimidine kinase [Arachidicoccus terrestris]|uniref:bifunctional hydroxymethylpyrimidine kinase/phosphomethylpyrimidine kinase n=1 Tax=Arachidicoccus terrestris TaxID=2875539 RepID=UPI001CC7C299|nr:bifunctional hydroxymethylpyrimidine kinase/phosphomethylpyrimidine kinase [Arachidicoccus terrestris]UAY55891.1 bifunctional hydroxymethylpyrimidine kinase/phosphomethylpyrimidine kinase [Arachidicoccus terrestris]
MEKYGDTVKRILQAETDRPFVLSIAGVDPSAGAGLLSDIKTLQSQGVYGLGLASCTTVQTDEKLYHVDWQNVETICYSLKTLCARFAIRTVKIGVMADRTMLQKILTQIHEDLPEALIVWDPVLKASSGVRFFHLTQDDLTGKNAVCWTSILQRCHVVTPNAEEAIILCRLLGLERSSGLDTSAATLDPLMRQISRCADTAVVLKGGHLTDSPPVDTLYHFVSATQTLEVHVAGRKWKREQKEADNALAGKHGSGCVHSSFLAAALAKGLPLPEAVVLAKDYMEQFLCTGRGNLGVHAMHHS